jgi:hypothetical protein
VREQREEDVYQYLKEKGLRQELVWLS